MKFSGLTFRQAQGEMIGQAGTSIDIMYFLVKKPDDFSMSAARDGDGMGVVAIADKDFLVVPHRVLCDDNKQNHFHTLAGLEMSLSNLKRDVSAIGWGSELRLHCNNDRDARGGNTGGHPYR